MHRPNDAVAMSSTASTRRSQPFSVSVSNVSRHLIGGNEVVFEILLRLGAWNAAKHPKRRSSQSFFRPLGRCCMFAYQAGKS
jgi:hypothetical protein